MAAAITAERLAPAPQHAARIARAAGTVVLVAGAVAIARACAAEDSLGRARALESRQAEPVDSALGIMRVVGSGLVAQSDRELALPRENEAEHEQEDEGP